MGGGGESQQNLLCLSHWSSLNLICSCLSPKASKHHHFKEQYCPLRYYWESNQWNLILPGKIALFHRFYSVLTLAAKYMPSIFLKNPETSMPHTQTNLFQHLARMKTSTLNISPLWIYCLDWRAFLFRTSCD